MWDSHRHHGTHRHHTRMSQYTYSHTGLHGCHRCHSTHVGLTDITVYMTSRAHTDITHGHHSTHMGRTGTYRCHSTHGYHMAHMGTTHGYHTIHMTSHGHTLMSVMGTYADRCGHTCGHTRQPRSSTCSPLESPGGGCVDPAGAGVRAAVGFLRGHQQLPLALALSPGSGLPFSDPSLFICPLAWQPPILGPALSWVRHAVVNRPHTARPRLSSERQACACLCTCVCACVRSWE